MRGKIEHLDLKAIEKAGSIFEVKDCMGKRLEAYDKCESCPDIVLCSSLTLKNKFSNIHIVGP